MPWCQRPKKGVVRLRKASVSRLTDLTGDARIGEPIPMKIGIPLAEHIRLGVVSGGTETSKYPEENKSTEIPQVAVSERGTAQTFMASRPGGPCHGRVARRACPDPSRDAELQIFILAEGPGMDGHRG